ncbi:MAG: hypothetical protein Kow00121_55420 [Elainellaceae cyanobacterium]
MAFLSDSVIRRSALLGRLVLNHRTAEELGRVDQLWLDPKSHQVIGLMCRSGLFYNKKHCFPWSQIEAIGSEGILVTPLETVEFEKPESAVAEPGQEVWTNTGSRVGSLLDYRLDSETGDVIDYLFTFAGWREFTDGIYRIFPNAVIGMNDKRAIVLEAAVQNAELFEKGFSQSVAQISGLLQTDISRSQQDLQALKQAPQAIVAQLQTVTQKAKQKLTGATGANQEQPPLLHSSDTLPSDTLPSDLEAEDVILVKDKDAAESSFAEDQTIPEDSQPGSNTEPSKN